MERLGGRCSSLQASISRRLAPRVNLPGVRIEPHDAWHPEETVGRRRVRWTDGDAELAVHAPAGVDVPIVLTIARMQPRELPQVEVAIEVAGAVVSIVTVRRTESRTDRVLQPVRFTVVGRGVNLFSRIEVINPPHALPRVFSAYCAALWGGGARSLGRHELKGFAAPQEVFTLAEEPAAATAD